MKRYLTFCLILVVGQLFAQNTVKTDQGSEWKTWEDSRALPEAQFFDQYRAENDLNANFQWKEVDRSKDALGQEHARYEQYYQNLQVLGHQYILHSENGKVHFTNGRIAPDININTQPFVTAEEALKAAMDHIDAEVYAWEKRGPFFGRKLPMPAPELVVLDALYPQFSGRYILAYAMEISAIEPHLREQVLVNAWSGEVINSIPKMYSCGGDAGEAETLYYGEKEIITMSTDSGFVLMDDTRGGGISTMQLDSVMFVDDDNFWEMGSSTQANGALDVHIGVGATYDYFLEKFGRKGIDGNDSPIAAFVYVDEGFNNAFWNGEAVFFGDGDKETYGPFTAVDVCAHEVTHGITEFTSGLVYQYESGALNEGFSDIFGKAVEAYFDPDNFTWELGFPMQLDTTAGFRNMEDPHNYQHPKFYKGLHWIFDPFDNGGVHFNSGVINHWFYLLCEGGSDANEVGNDFDVDSIGMDKAAGIAFRALTIYLTPTSQYLDARFATLKAAEDLYGICSDEYRAVADAWYAVGVGERIMDGDVSFSDHRVNLKVCEGRELEISARIINNGCQTVIPSGTEMTLSYSVNELDTVVENFVLAEDLEPGNFADFTFSQTAELGMVGGYNVEIMVDMTADADTSNNSTFFFVRQTEDLESDASLRFIRFISPSCGSSSDSLQMNMALIYEGCSIVPTGEIVEVEVIIEGVSQVSELTLERDLYPDGFFFGQVYLKNIPFGNNDATVILHFPGDENGDNDLQMGTFVYMQSSIVGYEERFDGLMMDSTRLTVQPLTSPERHYGKYALQSYNGEDLLVLSGGFPEIAQDAPEFEAFQQINSRYIADVRLCFQSDGWLQPRLIFEMAQTRSSFDYSSRGFEAEWANTLSVLINDGRDDPMVDMVRDISEQIEFNTYTYALPIDKGLVDIILRAMTLKGEDLPTGEVSLEDQDLILLDNIRIVETVNTSEEDYGDIEIFPNPAYDHIRISLGQTDQTISNVTAINARGQQIPLSPVSSRYHVGQLASGVYWLQIELENGTRIWKLFVKK